MAGSCLWGHGPQASQAGTGTLLWPPGLRCRVPFGLVSTCVWSHKTRRQGGKRVRSILRKVEKAAGRPGPKERGRRRQQGTHGQLAKPESAIRAPVSDPRLPSRLAVQGRWSPVGRCSWPPPGPWCLPASAGIPVFSLSERRAPPPAELHRPLWGGPRGGPGSPGLEPQLHS